MNLESENQVPVAEQLQEINQVEEAIKAEYNLGPDGSIEQIEGEAQENA